MDVRTIDAGGDYLYRQIYVGSAQNLQVQTILLDVSGMTTAEVDANGYLKPGTPLTSAGILVTAGAAYGITFEPIKLRGRSDNATPALAGDTKDTMVAVMVAGAVSQRNIEINLGRVLTAAEIAGILSAGCELVLV